MHFGFILERFWETKISVFRIFFGVFSGIFSKHTSEDPKWTQEAQQDADDGFLGLVSGGPQPPGERKREGNKSLDLHKELDLSDSQSVIGQDVSDSDGANCPARPAHLRWAAD